ncbi:MAG TPA: class I SAM-dependent methyltransferase [Humisphaera sp.]
MSTTPPPARPHEIWDRIAPWWAEAIGEGNDFQLRLIMPTTDRLLEPRPGLRVLDVCCGNGNYARRLGRAGCRVLAVDASENFLADARRRTTAADGDVAYARCDATDEAALLALGEAGSFDAVVCSMAVMDLPTVAPLFRAARRLLGPAGRFVYSVSHPCFNSNGSRMTAELVNEGGRTAQVFGVHITRYLRETTDLASGILNQPEPHYTFHRPIHVLVREAVSAGLSIDAMEEPAFPPESGAKSAFSWAKRPDVPPALVVRMRPA